MSGHLLSIFVRRLIKYRHKNTASCERTLTKVSKITHVFRFGIPILHF